MEKTPKKRGIAFKAVYRESARLLATKERNSLSFERMKVVKKNLKRKREEQEFFDVAYDASSKVLLDRELAKEDFEALKKHLIFKKKSHSEAWSSIDSIMHFGGKYSVDRYSETKKFLNEDKMRYEAMSVIVEFCLERS